MEIIASHPQTKARIARKGDRGVWQVLIPSHRVSHEMGVDIVLKVASEHKTKAQARKALQAWI